MNPLTAVQFFKQWWFLFAALGSITISGLVFGITLNARVEQLMEKGQVDDLQWLNIRANVRRGIEHEGEISAMQEHMGPIAIQQYGALKSTVAFDHERLERHLNRHNEPR